MTDPRTAPQAGVAEQPVEPARGTRDWLPADYARLDHLKQILVDQFARAGYEPMSTPVLEATELHERKSGAGIVSKLFAVAGAQGGRLCLRPELTASLVRAFTAAAEPPPTPWRVSLAGPVFRFETPQPGRLREFQQVGVELLGASGPAADAEVIGLADGALRAAGLPDATLRIGHVGLILEMLGRSGLPPAARAALVEVLSEAAAEGRGIRALEAALEGLAGWLRPSEAEGILPTVERADDPGVDRLFRTLVPDVTGRRSGHEIIGRLRRKWDLGHSLHRALGDVRDRVHELADLRGPAAEVLGRLDREYRDLAPESVAALRGLMDHLAAYGLGAERTTIDLGFSRGIGFYSQMVFELAVPTPAGPVEVCGGGRYDGLARVLGSDRDDRGVGFAFGLERLLGALEARGVAPERPSPAGFLIVSDRPEGRPAAARVAAHLRTLGARAVLEAERAGPEAAAFARELGVAWVVTLAGPPDGPRPFRILGLVAGETADASARELDDLARADLGGTRR